MTVFLARLAVFLLAAAYAWGAPPSVQFRLYLVCQFISTVGLFLAERLLGRQSVAYLWIYLELTALVLSACFFLSYEALRYHKAVWMAVAAALGFAIAFDVQAWDFMKGTFSDKIALGEAGVLIFCAILIGSAAPYQPARESGVSMTLALLWLVLAGFRLGYRVGHGQEGWEIANQVVPCVLVSAAIGWCGVLLRHRGR